MEEAAVGTYVAVGWVADSLDAASAFVVGQQLLLNFVAVVVAGFVDVAAVVALPLVAVSFFDSFVAEINNNNVKNKTSYSLVFLKKSKTYYLGKMLLCLLYLLSLLLLILGRSGSGVRWCRLALTQWTAHRIHRHIWSLLLF